MLALQVDCAELLGSAAGTVSWFTRWNGDPLSKSRFRLWRTDGRSILRFAPQTYDIIASEPSNLWVPGVAHLFTQEAFEDARSRLTPGTGIYAQWLHAYGLDASVLQSVLRTFMDVFPEVSLWTTSLDRQDLLLVGSDRPVHPDPESMARIIRTSGFQDHIRPGHLLTPTSVLRRFVAGRAVLEQAVAGAEPVREQDPGLEYVAERTFRADRADRTAELHGWLASLMRQQERHEAATMVPGMLSRRRETSIRIREVLAADSDFDGLARNQLESRLQSHLAPLVSALEADPDDDALRFVLGKILQEWGTRFGKAGAQEQGLRVLWHSLNAWPKQETVVATVLDFLSRTGQHNEAAQLLARFEQAEPTGPSHRLRGRLAMAGGRYDEAIVHFELVLQENPISLNALGNLGLCHRAQGQTARAQGYFRRILDLNPHNDMARARLAESTR